MYSTQNIISRTPPEINAGNFCGSRLVLEATPGRKSEGGLRLQGSYKQSLPGFPLVTVITVVMNMDTTIEQCILSILNQTCSNIEYIIIDGGSSDKTLSIINKYKEALDYFVSEPDNGIYSAMNKGISLASGSYLLFLNADDWYEPDAIGELLAGAIESNADVVYADANIIDGNGQKKKRLDSWLHDGLYTRGASIRHETMLVKSSIYNKFGPYDESYQIISDFEYMIRLYEGACEFLHIRKPVLNFRDAGVSNVGREKREAERERFFSSLFPFLDEDDLSVLKVHGNLPLQTRQALIDKHMGNSGLFTRSNECNIADRINFEKNISFFAKYKNKLFSFINKIPGFSV